MGKIAIVGVEGSGKTVLMAALGAAYERPDENGMFLSPKNQEAFKFSMSYMHLMREKQQWPSATMTDSLRYLEWELRTKTEVIAELSILDYAGEIYRRAFSESGDNEQYSAEMETLLRHITEADTLLILVNLRDVIDGDRSSARTLDTLWLNKAILEFARKVPTIANVAIVLTQADKYQNIIHQCGGPKGTLEKYLPFVMNVYHDIPVMAVSAVDKTEPDGDGIPHPTKDFQSEGIHELMEWFVSLNPEANRIISDIRTVREAPRLRYKEVLVLSEKYQEAASESSKIRHAIACKLVEAAAVLSEACKAAACSTVDGVQDRIIMEQALSALDFEKKILEILNHLSESGLNAAWRKAAALIDSSSDYEKFRNSIDCEIKKEYDCIVQKFEVMLAKVKAESSKYHENAEASSEVRKQFAKNWKTVTQELTDFVGRNPGITVHHDEIEQSIARTFSAVEFESKVDDILNHLDATGCEAALMQASALFESMPEFNVTRESVFAEIRRCHERIVLMRRKKRKRRLLILFLLFLLLLAIVIISSIISSINAEKAYRQEINAKRQQGYSIVSQDGKEVAVWHAGVSHPSRPGVISSERPGYWKLTYPYRWESGNSENRKEEREYNTKAVWCPYLPHPEYRNIVSGISAGIFIPASGYQMVNAEKFTVKWIPGIPHLQYKGIISEIEEGHWRLKDGYKWKNGTASDNIRTRISDLDVIWSVGSPHSQNNQFRAGAREGIWDMAPGYVDDGNFKSHWASGIPHPANPKLISGEIEGTWDATAPGYVWDGNAGVRWQAGLTSKKYPHWISISTPEKPSGYWKPIPGYSKKNPNAPGMSELVWKCGIIHPTNRNLVSSNEEGKWETRSNKPGYIWDGNEGVSWNPGMVHPHCSDLVSAKKEGQWETKKNGYVWDGGNSIRWQAGLTHPYCRGLESSSVEGQWNSRQDGYIWDGENGIKWQSGLPSGKTLPAHWISQNDKDRWSSEDGYVRVDPQNKYVSPLKWDSSWNNGNKRATSIEGVFEYKKSCWKCSGTGKANVDAVCNNCKGVNRQPCNPLRGVAAFAPNGVHLMQCSQCKGSGRVFVVRGLLNSTWEVCRQCNGVGGVVCTNCGGSGVWTCPNCKGGKVKVASNCDECNGSGYYWRR